MTDGWNDDMDAAPRDGTAFQARIPGHGDDNIIAWTGGLLDERWNDCGSWYFVEDQEPPDCWTDGVCWASKRERRAISQTGRLETPTPTPANE